MCVRGGSERASIYTRAPRVVLISVCGFPALREPFLSFRREPEEREIVQIGGRSCGKWVQCVWKLNEKLLMLFDS